MPVLALPLAGACGEQLPVDWAYVTRVSSSAATVAWTSHGNRVVCRDVHGHTASAPSSTWGRGLKTARVEGLRPDARHACRIRAADGGVVGRVRFRTAPGPESPFTFAALGDSGHGGAIPTALALRIRDDHPAFLVHLGDLAYGYGQIPEFAGKFFRPFRGMLARVPLFPVPGNHDLYRSSVYHALFSPAVAGRSSAVPHYAFAWGPAYFVALDSDAAAADPAGLKAELAHAPPLPWRIVFLHEPLYTAGHKWTERGLRERVAPVLEAERVDLVLAGHLHFYERSEPSCEHVPGAGVVHVTSGGGSHHLDRVREHPNFPRTVRVSHYLRVRVHPRWLDLRAIGVGGRTIDHVRLRRDGPRACRADGWPAPKGR
jgi:acid phosphatase